MTPYAQPLTSERTRQLLGPDNKDVGILRCPANDRLVPCRSRGCPNKHWHRAEMTVSWVVPAAEDDPDYERHPLTGDDITTCETGLLSAISYARCVYLVQAIVVEIPEIAEAGL